MALFQRRGSKGFTLVEVMVSLMIFMIASMGLLPLLMTNLQTNHGNSRQAQAQRLAGERMAELQVTDYAALAMLADDPFLIAGFELRQQVELNVPQPDQSRITVTASWQERGRSHRYQLQTIRSVP